MGAGHLHGLRVVVDALNGRQWEDSGNFPRESAINDDVDSRDVSDFCRSGLKTDGATIVHLIEENATIYQAAEFLTPLWEEFMSSKAKIE
ncbi:hypothetical protein NECAME_00737 [Necator americanus]|uniref:Uncharacterized protein n=1 Tax=Necator americanus TaxID=51031 RepID=W2SV77_NECAM|nr:hypothetical protein NECAME_00737 [Necator americanus]ETN73649.1 hypothetical protein NECAME_00737 [Necator americanus]